MRGAKPRVERHAQLDGLGSAGLRRSTTGGLSYGFKRDLQAPLRHSEFGQERSDFPLQSGGCSRACVCESRRGLGQALPGGVHRSS